ncbi:Succinate semialdehyde dehydrogenase [NAD(P)+] Sad [Fundidesulfovibrio magnetotacticus]|uniref:Succinate semialdehyde dehydrogenase [NAD(P)+] Sad n=1 Tax=Fundidesulfovibrio magnetotacticus TaxID=2730080 RepID=A0A6V8M2W4_9BACT|nr:aldehyde dehydrogenase family protein [Fundidesulfovibrio magnetotacticus]GFK94785.1 Succinate semialdehyde dehydrogenase [NAD(P)+] Sad [Fundidesulfovibrio magnetotacticus]
MTPFKSINPATGREATSFEEHTPAQVEAILADMRNAQRCWRNFRLDERAECLRRVADNLAERAQDYARLITAEMGKPIGESLAEITRCANVCRFYADHGPAMLAPETPEGAPQGARIVHEPLGIVLAVMPWNFPFWQVLRAAAPALLAGNAFLCKHAPSVTGCSLALEEALSGVGMSDGLYRALVVRDERVAAVVEDPRVRAVSLTGSRRAGAAVAEAAGRAVKKCVLELGGSDPFIVLADADLDLAVHTAVGARFYNAGQTCISAKRFLVDRQVVREFEERLTRSVGLLKMGDPLRPETRIGPMARADLREALDRQVRGSLDMGARMILEGGPVPGEGFFYRPAVLAGVRPGMPVFEEEVFGPVASVTSVDGPGEALRLANQTRYGLGASVWTRDLALGAKLAGNIEAGNVAVNTLLKSDPRLPFGGVKDSGYGRELGRSGLLEFVNAKVLRLPPGA